MANQKISEYLNTRNTFNDGDLFDVSAFLNPGYETQKTTYAILKANLASAGFLSSGDVDLSYTASTRTIGNTAGDDAILPLFTSTEAGLVPLSGGGTTNFLRADGTWAAAGADGNGIYTGSGNLSGGNTTITLENNIATPVTLTFQQANGFASDYYRADNTVGFGVSNRFYLNDSLGNKTQYGSIGSKILSNTDGSEDGEVTIGAALNNVQVEALRVTGKGIIGNNNIYLDVHREFDAGGSGINMRMNNSIGNSYVYGRYGVGITTSTSGNESGYLYFGTPSAGVLSTKMYLGSTGQLAIGTTLSGTQTLKVGGDTQIDGDLTVDVNTLFVDSTLNKISIGGVIGASKLTVYGDLESTTDILSTKCQLHTLGNFAMFSHRNYATSGNWGFAQDQAGGGTRMNAPVGQSMLFQKGAVTIGQFNASNQFLVGNTANHNTISKIYSDGQIQAVQGVNVNVMTAPAAPANGFIIYVDSADGDLKAISSTGVVTTLALN